MIPDTRLVLPAQASHSSSYRTSCVSLNVWVSALLSDLTCITPTMLSLTFFLTFHFWWSICLKHCILHHLPLTCLFFFLSPSLSLPFHLPESSKTQAAPRNSSSAPALFQVPTNLQFPCALAFSLQCFHWLFSVFCTTSVIRRLVWEVPLCHYWIWNLHTF